MPISAHPLSSNQLPSMYQVGGPKLDRPTMETGVSMEEWIMFTRRWNIFREGSQIASVPMQRWEILF